eukprot:TRINITY_DN3049_c0_g1_i3.p1 TRINITY_DN3049_c0_g1~~TRINITY_DN3049_c0_g1_i3.p1  ORF type:complete len:268 (-),score=21.35 TRINITY_DN3049_c0_g1_i3:237-1040(-)
MLKEYKNTLIIIVFISIFLIFFYLSPSTTNQYTVFESPVDARNCVIVNTEGDVVLSTSSVNIEPRFNLLRHYKPNNEPHLCIGIRTMKSQESALVALMTSVMSSNSPQVSFHVIDTEGDFETLPQLIKMVNGIYGRTVANISQASTKSSLAAQFPQLTQFTDFGYTMTDFYLKSVLDDPTSKCNYISFTNGDNFYALDFMPSIAPEMSSGKDLIGYEFVTHHDSEPDSFRARGGIVFFFSFLFFYFLFSISNMLNSCRVKQADIYRI